MGHDRVGQLDRQIWGTMTGAVVAGGMPEALAELDTADLAQRAAEGDREAAGALFTRRMPLLSEMARRLSTPTIDPDDLLSEALTNLLGKWAAGSGPRDNVEAYVIRSMRNRATDEMRSPRSRGVPLDVVPEPVFDVEPTYDPIEMYREYAMVRKAMARLPDDQRKVLTATVIDGRKPGDLVQDLGRPAAAIYSLLRRAKLQLRRTLLQVMLEQDARPECGRCAQELPAVVTLGFIDQADSPSARHIRSCRHCGAAWGRYAWIATQIGVGTAVVVAVCCSAPAPAVAAETSAIEPHADRPVNQGHRVPTTLSKRSIMAMAMIVTSCLLALAVVVLPYLPVATSATSDPQGHLAVAASSPAADLTDIDVSFSVDKTPWTITRLTFEVPPDAAVVAAPPTWSCARATSTTFICHTPSINSRGGRFSFASSASSPARYRLTLESSVDRWPIRATSEGGFPR